MRPLVDYALAFIGGFILATLALIIFVTLFAKAVLGAVL